MKNKIWLWWLYLALFCCILGFIPEPDGLVKALTVLAGVSFFIPGAILLVQGNRKNCRRIFFISLASLVLTTLSIILNFASILMPRFWGTVLYIVMGILSTPMLCCRIWVISLFGWACFLVISGFRMGKKT